MPGDPLPWAEVARSSRGWPTRCGLLPVEQLLISGGRWWSYLCVQPGVLPGRRARAAGRRRRAFAAAATVDGPGRPARPRRAGRGCSTRCPTPAGRPLVPAARGGRAARRRPPVPRRRRRAPRAVGQAGPVRRRAGLRRPRLDDRRTTHVARLGRGAARRSSCATRCGWRRRRAASTAGRCGCELARRLPVTLRRDPAVPVRLGVLAGRRRRAGPASRLERALAVRPRLLGRRPAAGRAHPRRQPARAAAAAWSAVPVGGYATDTPVGRGSADRAGLQRDGVRA